MTTLNMIRGREVILPLTNQSGGAIIAGDVVIVSTAADESFTTTTSAAYNSTRVGVALESIAAAAAGRVLLEGYAPLVNVSASATRGHYLLTHTVAKQATSQAGYAAGAFGQILKAGTTPSAMIFPVAQVGSAGVTRSGATTDEHLAVWDGSNADSIKDGGVAGGAPTTSYYVLGAADAGLANGVVIPALRYHPDIVPASPNAFDDEFDAAALDGKWTWLNQGSSTATLNSNSYLELAAQAEAASQVRGIYQATAGATWRYRAKVCLVSTTYASYVNVGMFAREAATGKIVTHGLMVNRTTLLNLRIDRWTNATTYSVGLLETMSASLMGYLELELTATNFVCKFSLNGVTFATNYSATKTTDFTTAPDQVGLFGSSFLSNTVVTNSCDWVRKIA